MWKPGPETIEAYREILSGRRDSRYMDYPYQICFESMSLCNAKCNFCPYPSLSRKGAVMSDALIEKILSDCRSIPADLPFKINPFQVSEPFLDKRIFDICQTINDTLPNAEIHLFSNGSPLNSKNLSKLAAVKNVFRLVISLHEKEPEAYARVVGLPFERTIKNVETLHAMKASGEITFPVEISRVGDGSELDDEFCRWGREKFPLFTVYATARTDWIGAVNTLVSPVPQAGCGQWFNLNIMSDGRMMFCCVDSDGRWGSGDVNKQHILEIYNQPERRRLRESLVDRAQVKQCAGCSILG
jgi:sulfatase maturation enzyme AslB (radical SAM superfamily)